MRNYPSPDDPPAGNTGHGYQELEQKPFIPLNPPSQSAVMMSLAFLANCTGLIATCIVDLCLYTWIEYCGFRANLWRYEYSFASSWITYNRYIHDFCDDDEVTFCGGICKRTRELRAAGIVMLLLASIAIALLIFVLLRVLILTVNPTPRYGEKLVKISLVAATAMWFIGTAIEIGVFAKVADNGGSRTNIRAGLELAIALIVWQVLNCMLGFLAVQRLRRTNGSLV